MHYLMFLRRHPRLLSFGLLLTLFSSFGQTYLISIFVPSLLEGFSITSGRFGAVYSAATLTSALLLPYFGRLLDRVHLGRYCLSVGTGLVLACWVLAAAPNVAVLFLGILGLRLTGQGLLGLTSATAMVRLAPLEHRGKALSVSSAGYPLGEGILPILMVLLLRFCGWRVSWGILGGFIAVAFLPALYALVKGLPCDHAAVSSASEPDAKKAPVLLKDWRFYLFLPGVLSVGFILTGIFLYQLKLAESKGWDPTLMATGFLAFAATRMLSSIIIGHWVDRLGADRLFPFSLLPLALGLFVLHSQAAAGAVFLFFVLAGISQGVSGVIMSALWAQRYGVSMLGRVKGQVSMLGVFSSAGSPILFGWLLTVGIGFDRILPASVALCLVSVAMGLVAQRLCFPRRIPRSDHCRRC